LALELRMPTLRGHLKLSGGFLALISVIILALPFVPGPGIRLVGVAILSDHFVWAKRLLLGKAEVAAHSSRMAVAS
jgi:hypothetical protein